MKTILSLLLVIALSAPEALSAGRRGAPGGRAPVKPNASATATPDPAASNPLEDMKKACAAPDSFIAPFPKPSENPTVVTVDAPTVDDSKWGDLKFDNHCKVGSAHIDGCDVALSLTLKSVREGKLALNKLRDEVCKEKLTEADKCGTQQESLKCVHGIYNSLAEEFRKTSEQMKENAKKLKDLNNLLQRKAKVYVVKVPLMITDPAHLLRATRKVDNEAKTGASLHRGPAQTNTCAQEVFSGTARTSPPAGITDQVRNICSQITAASDTAYYSAQLTKVASETELAAKQFKGSAEKIQANIDKGNSTGPGGDTTGNKKGGILDSMGGLDGLMKMATLGMMGAGLYCSVSGECSQKPSAVTAADPNAGLGATAPTPASTNPGPETSNTGDNQKIVNNNPIATQPETSTKVDPLSGSEGFSTTGGFSSDKDQALAPFSGALERAPASAGAPGGGGGGGSGSSDSGAPRDPATDAQKSSSYDTGIGSGSGGGGLAHSGGFSLGDPGSASPTDSALKNILNGDMPPGDAGLASILDGDPGATAAAEGGIDMQGAESLFLRVRDTHVRCVKRGCVGHEVGEHI